MVLVVLGTSLVLQGVGVAFVRFGVPSLHETREVEIFALFPRLLVLAPPACRARRAQAPKDDEMVRTAHDHVDDLFHAAPGLTDAYLETEPNAASRLGAHAPLEQLIQSHVATTLETPAITNV
ncbi:hypothetical protein SDRG_15851 [Saprolegnia diclina VS20]|uniref:Secreted protein n=1 Tax=Saprolegnia diclina (strain VS20) TaxID=1156394 RepID=T0PVR8_SAPDV|nr:hypothetical protein SDRG_15851 [Saprolegnia diclina VS20]EQC26366.1 hypothetical protein SDRG_15851 [Saprolegnia diclina VS20]|eukprot:XP_008620259.1 hypothetical protein SDRG_15851 [Saprolegnia diclina VS20]